MFVLNIYYTIQLAVHSQFKHFESYLVVVDGVAMLTNIK